jgi:hypothetical protein
MQAASTTPETFDLKITNWENTRRAHLDAVPRDATVGEAVNEAVRAMQLPTRSFFQALVRGRQVNHGDTLEELGIDSDDEIQLVPDVSAGH